MRDKKQPATAYGRDAVTCPKCKHVIEIRANEMTVAIACPKCGQAIRVATPTYQRGPR